MTLIWNLNTCYQMHRFSGNQAERVLCLPHLDGLWVLNSIQSIIRESWWVFWIEPSTVLMQLCS